MEIKILQNADWNYGQYINSGYVLNTVESDSEFSNIKRVNYFLTDITTNEKFEILPNTEKYNIGKIVNTSQFSKYVYFVNINKKDDENINIVLMRFNVETKEADSLYSFSDSTADFNLIKRIKLFIINDLYIVMQYEYLIQNNSKTYAGFFKFSHRLINLKDDTEYEINDENINKNGIADIITVSENQCIIKTGFSLLEDNRYNELEKEECSLESVSFVNIGQFISDMAISKTEIALDAIEQSYYTKTISYIKKSGDYLIYSCVNNETKEEEVKFYNLQTGETRSCINQDVIRESDLAKAYVLNSIPYICIQKDNDYSFLNMITNKVDKKINRGSKLCKIFGDTLIFSGVKKTIFSKKAKPFFDIISFPQVKLLLHEQSEYIDSLITDNDIIYIIVK